MVRIRFWVRLYKINEFSAKKESYENLCVCYDFDSQGKSALWSHLLHYQVRVEKLEQQQQAEVPGSTAPPTSSPSSNTHF